MKRFYIARHFTYLLIREVHNYDELGAGTQGKQYMSLPFNCEFSCPYPRMTLFSHIDILPRTCLWGLVLIHISGLSLSALLIFHGI